MDRKIKHDLLKVKAGMGEMTTLLGGDVSCVIPPQVF
jgi:hypothetical protein